MTAIRLLMMTVLSMVLCIGPAAWAEAPKPSELNAAIKASKPLGAGEMHFLLLHVYDAQLWTDAAHWSYDSPFAISLVYRMDIDGDDLVDRSIQEMETTHGAYDEATKKSLRQQLTKAFPDVSADDRLTALYEPSGSVTIYYNGARRSVIQPPFARQFMDIWLSEKTSQPKLRKQLIHSES